MAPATRDRRLSTLREAYDDLKSGDVALWRASWPRGWRLLLPSAWVGILIAVTGRSAYCHAGLLVRVRSQWMVAELVEGVGGRLYPLDQAIRRHPGAIDVYRVDLFRPPDWNASQAVEAMLHLVGVGYGYSAVLRSWLLHLPIVRLVAARFAREKRFDDLGSDPRPMFCSAGVSWALRYGGGVDPVANLADHYTEPGDLARSAALRYQLTLESAPASRAAAYFEGKSARSNR